MGLFSKMFHSIREPLKKSASQLWMESFKVGQKASFLGKEVTVSRNTVDWWDDEWSLPLIEIVWWDNNGKLQSEELDPSQVKALLKHYL